MVVPTRVHLRKPYCGGVSIPECLGGRYELRGVLGIGGMGEVRDGWDSRLHRAVAVKLLRAGLADQADVRVRFEAEAKAAATLNDPHVVVVYDSGEDAGVAYIVMERLPGNTLADEIARGPMAEGRVRRILIEVLGALAVAHDAGILHRDVKPGNILFSAAGTVKVSDFGIAKSADSDQTIAGQILGTAAYISPERLSGQPASISDDLYALGMVGYEALCGHKPFAEDSPLALVRAICYEPVPPLAGERSGLDAGLVSVIDRAMARQPELRFSSARSMLAALQSNDPATITEALRTSDATQVLTPPARAEQGAAETQVVASFEAGQASAPARPASHRRIRGGRLGRRLPAMAAAAVVVVLLIVFVATRGNKAAPSPPAGATPTSVAPIPASVPASLASALDNLQKAVTP